MISLLIKTVSYGLSTGKKYVATIDRISGSGNGIIKIGKSGHINLGEMSQSKVGKTATFIYKGGHKGVLSGIRKESEAIRISDLVLT